MKSTSAPSDCRVFPACCAIWRLRLSGFRLPLTKAMRTALCMEQILANSGPDYLTNFSRPASHICSMVGQVYSLILTNRACPGGSGISLRAFNRDCPRHEDRTLNGGLCRCHTELKLALIELSNNLTHGDLIQIRRSSHRSRSYDGACWRDSRRHGDESRPSHGGAERYDDDTNYPCQPFHRQR
jgi:hypothetical protein